MKKLITLVIFSLLVPTLLTSCSGISQENYDDVIAQLNTVNTNYVQARHENENLKTRLEESSKKIDELQTQLTQSAQTISSLKTELDSFKSLPLETDVVIRSGTVIRGRMVKAPFNYFQKIEGKLIGDGFRAYLKSGDNIILDLGTNYEREFSFIPTDPFAGYLIDYEIIDNT